MRTVPALLMLALLAACAAPAALHYPMGQASFEDYQRETREWLAQRRAFQTADHDSELAWNSPAEWRPAGTPVKGILLFHGLGDSPWSFADIGQSLAAQGYLVRTALLPGHGTQPADLLGVDVDDWRRLVREQVAVMSREVPQVMLGGFSTGANLALEYALDHPEIAGLLLFSPAFKASVPGDWTLPLLAQIKPWLRQPDSSQAQQTPVRYLNVPTNGFAQFYRGSAAVRGKISGKAFDRPALLVVAQHDSVVDVDYVRDAFARRFTHPASRMVWYGDLPGGKAAPPRVLVRTDRLPEARISQFSHMGVLFSPGNPLYGREGSQRFCWNGQSDSDQRKCIAGAPVWYSDWGYAEPGKIHARLTFNPYFDWQAGIMKEVMSHAPRNP
jgi:esterase/lipase